MPTINTTKMCNIHGFYNAIENKNGCPLCRKDNNKQYDTILRAKDRKQIYNSKKWQIVREKALIRDMLLCQHCLKNNLQTRATEVHHIQYLEHRIDLAYDLNNLISLCTKCHMSIHGED